MRNSPSPLNLFRATAVSLALCVFVGSSTSILASTSDEPSPRVQSGLEVLLDERIELIEDKRIGIVTNHTACDAEGRHIIDRIAARTKVVALFGPEHGIRGDEPAGAKIAGSVDGRTGAKVFSLYGEHLQPTGSMLQGIDLIVFDIQDIGAKFYTYISTLFLVMESCAREGIPVLVLDRPNPIGGIGVEGDVTSPAFASFVGVAPLCARHGMTVGELARMFNGEGFLGHRIDAKLTVVPCKGWQRGCMYDETGLPWIPPSPNIPTLAEAMIYPGTCFLEGTNLSEGRGTPSPFLLVGAPWLDGNAWADSLNAEGLPGVRFESTAFTPVSIPGKSTRPKHQDQRCNGVRILVTNRDILQPVATGVAILVSARNQNPEKFEFRRSHLDRLWGNQRLRSNIEDGLTWREIMKETEPARKRFLKVRAKYLLYK